MPETKIFEETKIKLSLKVTKGEAKEKSAEFTLLVDGDEHSKHTSKLESGAFVWPTTAPKVDDAKVKKWPFGLKYQVKHEGKTYDGAEEWQVWPKTLELKPAGNDGPAQLKLLQADKVVAAPPQIAKDATANATLKLTQESTVVSVFPWKVKDGGVTDKGRTRTVELEKIPYKVHFVLLDDGADPAAPVKQILNLKSEGKKGTIGLDHKGHTVDLNVKVQNVDPSKYAETEGTTVYVRITFSDKTKRDDPKFPRKLVADGVTVNGDVQTGTTKLGKDGFAKFSIELGLAGGEKCKVEVGTTDAYGDDVRHFESWRQLHFQLSHPAGAAKPAPADYVAACAGVKLKMEEEAAGIIAAGSGPAGAWIPGDEVVTGFGRPALVIGTHNEKAFHKATFKNKNDDRYAHFLICDFQFDSGSTVTHEFQLDAAQLDATGARAVLKLWDFENQNDSGALLPTSIKDGKAAVRKLSYRVPSTKKKGDLTVFEVDYPNNSRQGGALSVVLPNGVLNDFNAGEPVFIKFQAHLAVGPYLGSSTKNLLLIATHDGDAPRPTDRVNQTLAHEVGHALGMVAGGISIPGIADPKAEHTRAYTGRGHQGGHCAKGVSQATYDGGGSLGGKSGTCIMFGEGADSVLSQYCDLCHKLMLPAALDKYALEKL